MNIADEIFDIYERRGQSAYYGEAVSQLEHALQAAHFAEGEGAMPALVAAALLHDIGHLLDEQPEDVAEQGIDTRHEEVGQAWLRERFGPEVCDPVRLHVAAKRYLCATDYAYRERLSSASALSLRLQGGPMTVAEVDDFEANEYFRDAVTLRRWDDQAKVQAMATEPLRSYRGVLEGCALH